MAQEPLSIISQNFYPLPRIISRDLWAVTAVISTFGRPTTRLYPAWVYRSRNTVLSKLDKVVAFEESMCDLQ